MNSEHKKTKTTKDLRKDEDNLEAEVSSFLPIEGADCFGIELHASAEKERRLKALAEAGLSLTGELEPPPSPRVTHPFGLLGRSTSSTRSSQPFTGNSLSP